MYFIYLILFQNLIFYSDLFQTNRFICYKSIYLMYIDLKSINWLGKIDLFTKTPKSKNRFMDRFNFI